MLVNDDFEIGLVSRWTPEAESVVRHEAIVAYSEAIGETDERMLRGEVSPLMYGVVPSWRHIVDQFNAVIPPSGHGRQVHGEHVITSPRPLRPGDILQTRARLVGVKPTSKGSVVAIEAESRSTQGELLVHQVSTAFVIGVIANAGVGELPTNPAAFRSSRTQVVEMPTDLGLPARYASASGDDSPIHLDDDAAKAIGLPGVILHGMCSLALAGRAVVSAVGGGDPTQLRRLGCRFTGVAFPGDPIVVEVSGSGQVARFSAADADGRQVLSSGQASIGAPAAG